MAIGWIIGQQLLRATYSGENIAQSFSLPLAMKGLLGNHFCPPGVLLWLLHVWTREGVDSGQVISNPSHLVLPTEI